VAEETTTTVKKSSKKKKFFLFVLFAALIAAAVKFVKGRRGQGFDESEWQELPPPSGG
jgi:hypothetical protein